VTKRRSLCQSGLMADLNREVEELGNGAIAHRMVLQLTLQSVKDRDTRAVEAIETSCLNAADEIEKTSPGNLF
jgi:hypothetical protein